MIITNGCPDALRRLENRNRYGQKLMRWSKEKLIQLGQELGFEFDKRDPKPDMVAELVALEFGF